MKNKNLLIIIGVLSICYMYVCDMANSAGLESGLFALATRRAGLLTMAVLFCLFGFILENSVIEHISLVALIFSFYMFIVGFNNKGDATTTAFISCVVYWAVLLTIFRGIDLQEDLKDKITTICAVTSILISIIYIYGLFTLERKTVGFSNSVYFVLCSIVFGLTTKVKFLRIISIVAASAAILFAAKTTCIVALIIVLGYFFSTHIFDKSIKSTFSSVLIFLIAFIVINELYNILFSGSGSLITALTEDLQGDFESGSGRYDIFERVLNAFGDSSFSQAMFGHGYNSVSNYIEIGAHNDFLQVLFDYGVVGLILYLWFWIKLVKEAIRVKKAGGNHKPYVASLLIFLCLSMASNVINSQIQMMFLVMFWGVNKYTENNERDLINA